MSSNFMHKGRGQASVRPVQVFMAKGSNVSWTFGLVFYFHHIHCEYFSMIWQPIKTIPSTPSFLFRRIKLQRSYFSTIFLSFFYLIQFFSSGGWIAVNGFPQNYCLYSVQFVSANTLNIPEFLHVMAYFDSLNGVEVRHNISKFHNMSESYFIKKSFKSSFSCKQIQV